MNKAKDIQAIVEESTNIVITSHRSPDGDSIGSSLGLYHLLQALGKTPTICHPDPCPAFITWAKGDVDILDFENQESEVVEAMNAADLIFCLDYNGSNRLGKEMGQVLLDSSAKRVMIDHHLDPEDIFDIAVSEPSVCSTAQLIVELTESISEDLMDEKIGTPLYLGIMTDTGSFRFSSVQPRTHEILAKLLRCGVKHSKIHEDTFDNNRLDRLKLRGYTIAEKLEIIPEHRTAIVSLTEDELEKFNYVKGDTEGLVNIALSVEGVDVAIFLSQKDDKVKMSFRSKGDIAVNVMAGENFSGGGHKNASGGINEGTMEDTIAKVKSLLPKYF